MSPKKMMDEWWDALGEGSEQEIASGKEGSYEAMEFVWRSAVVAERQRCARLAQEAGQHELAAKIRRNR